MWLGSVVASSRERFILGVDLGKTVAGGHAYV